MSPRSTLRPVGQGLATLMLVTLAGCAGDGHLHLLGYTTAPPYDDCIRTVYVPIFENVSFRRGLEFQLTRAVVREIEAKTPYKVVNCREDADTELTGKIINRRKTLVNMNQLGEVRDAEVMLAVELQWRDLRPGHLGEFLSQPDNARRQDPLASARQDPLLGPRQDPQLPGALRHARDQHTVVVQPVTHFIPELGGSVASAEKQLIDRLAVQIVSMMERW